MKRGDRPRAPGGAWARVERGRPWPARPTLRTRIALGRSTAIARTSMGVYSPRRCSCAPRVPRVQGMTEGKPSGPITRPDRTFLTQDSGGTSGCERSDKAASRTRAATNTDRPSDLKQDGSEHCSPETTHPSALYPRLSTGTSRQTAQSPPFHTARRTIQGFEAMPWLRKCDGLYPPSFPLAAAG